MKLVAYASKLYVAGMCLFSGAFASGIYIMCRGRHSWLTIAMMVIPIILIIVCVVGTLRGKPIITADENGFHDSRLGKSKIRWSDILAFEYAPRVRKTGKGEWIFSHLMHGDPFIYG